MKRVLLSIWPYAAALIAGISFYILGGLLSGNLRGLFHGIAGSFIAIPLLYIIYELSKKYSQQRLTKELFDYAKLQIDRELFSAIRYLMKAVWPYDQQDLTLSGITQFLKQSREHITNTLKTSEYLGFQVFRHWKVSQHAFESVLEHPLVIKMLSEDQAIAVIQLLKSVRSLQSLFHKSDSIFQASGKTVPGFRIQAGREMNEKNLSYPDRYLLLRSLSDKKYVVVDFADFPQYQVQKLLESYIVREALLSTIVDSVLDFISDVNQWIKLTGEEFLLDPQMFKIAPISEGQRE